MYPWSNCCFNAAQSGACTDFQNLLIVEHPKCQEETGVLSPAVSDQGVKLTTHLHLVLRLRLSGAIHGHLYLLHTDFILSLFCGKRTGKYLQRMSSL